VTPRRSIEASRPVDRCGAGVENVATAARRLGWRTALDQFEPGARLEAENPIAAAWVILVPLPADVTVVDLDPGWGAVAAGLAGSVAQVAAVTPSPVRAAFLAQRFREDGIANVLPVVGTPAAAPFRPATADVIIAGRSLRAAGGASAQIAWLASLRGLLRPGGWTVITGPNRYTASALAGSPDHDLGLPWAGLLPARVARVYAALAGRPWRERSVHSARGYRRILADAGYEDVRLWSAEPDARAPALLVALAPGAFGHYLRTVAPAPRGRVRRGGRWLARRLGLLSRVGPAYWILARAGDRRG